MVGPDGARLLDLALDLARRKAPGVEAVRELRAAAGGNFEALRVAERKCTWRVNRSFLSKVNQRALGYLTAAAQEAPVVKQSLIAKFTGQEKFASGMAAIDRHVEQELERGQHEFVVPVRQTQFPMLGARLDVLTDLVVERLRDLANLTVVGVDAQPSSGIAWVRVKAPGKKCPDCANEVLLEARKCQHCGYRFESGT